MDILTVVSPWMKHLNMSTSYACSHVFLGISGALEWPDGSKCGQRKRRQGFCKMLCFLTKEK